MAGSSEGPIRGLTGTKGAAAGGQTGDAHGSLDGTGPDAELGGDEADATTGNASAFAVRANRQALSRRNQQELEELARLARCII